MSKSSQRKSEFLGINCGTAQNRLCKNILFHLVQETGRDQCYKCSLPIEKVKDLSIEHKVPWLDNDPALFWDLDNIAFSHRSCNRPHQKRGGKPSPRRGNNEMWLCMGPCGQYRPITDFSLLSGGRNNNLPRTKCKECRRQVQKVHGKNYI